VCGHYCVNGLVGDEVRDVWLCGRVGGRYFFSSPFLDDPDIVTCGVEASVKPRTEGDTR